MSKYSMSNTKDELLEAAQSHGLDVASSFTKQDILDVMIDAGVDVESDESVPDEAPVKSREETILEKMKFTTAADDPLPEDLAQDELESSKLRSPMADVEAEVIKFMKNAPTSPVALEAIRKACGVDFNFMKRLHQEGKVAFLKRHNKFLFQLNR